MSIRFRAIAALIMPVVLSGCGCGCLATASPIPVVATVAPGDLTVPGTLTICSDLRRPPLDMVKTGRPDGIDIYIGSDIAVRLGLKVKIENIDEAAIPASLPAGKCDIALSGLEIGSPETSGLLMLPYGELHQSLVVPVSNPVNISGLIDLCGRSIGVIAGSDEEASALGSGVYAGKGAFAVCTSAAKAAPTVRSYVTESDAEDALTSGQVAALFMDFTAGEYEVLLSEAGYNEGGFALINNVTDSVAELGLALPRGKPGLQVAVQKALDLMKADGSLANDWSAYNIGNVTLPVASGKR
jgi:polar amino acid transport system substrate-binding protein